MTEESIQQKEEFIVLVKQVIDQQEFVKLTFSKPVKRDGSLPKNIYGRLVKLKKGLALSCTLRYETEDVTKNYLVDTELEKQLEDWLGVDYLIATLLTTTEDIVLKFNKKRKARLLQTSVRKRKAAVAEEHNVAKQYGITPDQAFLEKLGVTNKDGKVLQGYHDKFRQINKYVEIMQALLEQSDLLPSEKALHIVDMGSGKGYLTFALYEFLQQMEQKSSILGVELRANLVEFCNAQSNDLGWSENLRFAAMDIQHYNAGDIDVLIALHACDVATDIAIAQGIKNDAALIVTAPCCHKQIRRAMHPKAPWGHILQQGILLERQAELVTDAIRALLLELAGYKVKVFEFISSEHTAKNVMISAVKSAVPLTEDERTAREKEIAQLKKQFGIEQHYLEKLLNGN